LEAVLQELDFDRGCLLKAQESSAGQIELFFWDFAFAIRHE